MTKHDDSFTRLDVCRRFLDSVRHSVVLGMEVISAEEKGVRARVPWSEKLVGNPETGIMHGGAMFAMMDHAGGMSVTCRTFPEFEITPTIDFRVDHLRAPQPHKAVVCEAQCYRLTSQVAFVRITAWEEGEEEQPVATAVATYTRMKIPNASKVVGQ